MNNLVSRLILVLVGIPLLYVLIVFFPQYGHAAIVAVVVFVSSVCGLELAQMFSVRGFRVNKTSFAILAALPPAVLWTTCRIVPSSPELATLFYSVIIPIFAAATFLPFLFPKNPEAVSNTLSDAAIRVFPLLYPGLFAAPLVLIADYPRGASEAFLWFLLMVFGNDSLAWAVGSFLGRHRNIVAISPNKSLEGFAGAFAGSLIAAFLGPVLFPSVIQASIGRIIALGIVVGCAVILGDLFESALKRSAGIKDSGTFIPGRGGFLDSVDSILFAAPVFYAMVRFLDII